MGLSKRLYVQAERILMWIGCKKVTAAIEVVLEIGNNDRMGRAFQRRDIAQQNTEYGGDDEA